MGFDSLREWVAGHRLGCAILILVASVLAAVGITLVVLRLREEEGHPPGACGPVIL